MVLIIVVAGEENDFLYSKFNLLYQQRLSLYHTDVKLLNISTSIDS